MTSGYDFSFSRQVFARALQITSPQKQRGRTRPSREGAGKTGCALHPRSRVQLCASRNAHEHTGEAEAVRPSLRNGFTAYFVLSPVIGLSCHRRHTEILRDLTPASRRQDHTTSPSAIARLRLKASPGSARVRRSFSEGGSASFVHAQKARDDASRPPQPAPTFVTMANVPSFGTGWRRLSR